MEKTRIEIWKDIVGYEGVYQISNWGQVRSLDRMRRNGIGVQLQRGQILKPSKNINGYLHVGLCKNGKAKTMAIHRLVAAAFIHNPMGLQQVNHKDENKTNNYVENLEWCSHRYNQNYGTRCSRVKEGNKGKHSKRIMQLTIEGEFLREWASLSGASKELEINIGHISNVLKGKRKQAGGFKWEYVI